MLIPVSITEPPAIPKAVKQEIRVKVDAVLQRMWEKRIVEEDAMPEDSIPPRYRTLDTVYEILGVYPVLHCDT